ncbi:MAG: sodium:solute symporter family protein [Campylobacteraceae bacterium]|nr:sodium:solute symporter family protein [Campylobacteraceae bacterium]
MVVSIVIAYLILMVLVGVYSSKRVSNNEDFMVAGRNLGPVLMAGTLAATEIGGGSSLGVVAKSYGTWGLGASWYIITMGIAFVVLSFVAPKLRTAEVKTVPEYFRRRYGKSAGLITAVIMIMPLIGLTAVQFIASATIVSVMLGLDFATSVTIVAIVVTVYSILGGLLAVALTDFIQVFLIVVGMALAIPFSLDLAGGMSNVIANVPKETMSMFSGIDVPTVIGLIIMYIASFTVGQEAVCRFYAARDEKAAVQGSIISAFINFIYAFIPTILGIITLALINMDKLDGALILKDGAKYALPHLAMATMPAVIVGLLFAGIISATMSSADSDLLGAGSIFGNDIYKVYINKDATQEQIMKITKIVMLIVAFFGWVIAISNTKNIIGILMFSFTLRAAGAFFPYVFGLYWKKSSLEGTIASLIVGSVVVVLIEHTSLSFFGLTPIIPGLLSSLVLFVGFSLVKPNKHNTCELVSE